MFLNFLLSAMIIEKNNVKEWFANNYKYISSSSYFLESNN